MIHRLSLVVTLVVAAFVLAAPASAHPLGNFTINHLSEIAIGRDRATVRYVLDMAEIPTYQAMREASPDGRLSKPQLTAWGRSEAATLLPQLALETHGRALPLVLDDVATSTRPGAGGLPTIYLRFDAHATLAAGDDAFAYRDGTFAGRLGWHDVVVAPQTEPTRELRAYPTGLLASPRALTAVTIARDAAGRAVATATPGSDATDGGSVPSSAVRSNQLSDMLARGTSDVPFVLLTFAVAIALGALHALEPGHGKTLLAISLVGARATVKQATILATALTVAHTIGVLLLGVAINVFKGYFVPETIYPWITLVSGVVIAVIGARAIQRQVAQRRPATTTVAVRTERASGHGHAHHAHGHDHDHAHGAHEHDHAGLDDLAHARAHAIPGNAPLTFGGTVWAAMSGGVAPCPAALVVLLAAIALNQVTYGIFVVVAFSFGLAATLTGLGIAVVRGASWLQNRPQFERFVKHGPLVSAVVISTIGAIMVGQGFAQRGISIPPVAVTALVALGIAAYAFSLRLARPHPAPTT